MKFLAKSLAAIVLCLVLTSVCHAQTTPAPDQAKPAEPAAPAAAAAPAAPAPLPTPAITGPLAGAPPFLFDGGPFGKIAVNGIVSGFATGQDNSVPGDKSTNATLGNGQVWIQKTDGWFQFYLQAGAYTMPALATPYMNTGNTVSNFYGALPVAFLKLVPNKTTSILIGQLPTLIGAEYTFTFENMNVERGLLWNQENAVSRGVQINQAIGKYIAASVSLNDGFYSNRYTWLTGSLTVTKGPHALAFVGGGNFDKTAFQTLATPVQNNSSIFNVIYTYTKGPWIIQPYFQYTNVPTNVQIGITNGASTQGEAILLSHAFKHGFSMAGRAEYISSTGTAAQNSVNLLGFGPGSAGTSVTGTPTFQYGGFFVRGDISLVHASNMTPGDTFGPAGLNNNQVRAVGEIGFIFGSNIVEKKP
ncbi:MAG: outer membrane beta-barrel protein [Acidobacteriota bacterium]|nr:outer membrane beta-barrel protein [Acidobacteriota bacterium]